MRRDNKFISTLASTADILNSIAGGISEPQVWEEKSSNAELIYVKVPGVSMENLKVTVSNNQLAIAQIMEVPTRDMTASLPRVVLEKPMPYYVLVEGITASIEDGVLVVRLPFNEKAKGYHRKITINR